MFAFFLSNLINKRWNFLPLCILKVYEVELYFQFSCFVVNNFRFWASFIHYSVAHENKKTRRKNVFSSLCSFWERSHSVFGDFSIGMFHNEASHLEEHNRLRSLFHEWTRVRIGKNKLKFKNLILNKNEINTKQS